jgi:lipopolysaccharide/colanic/teichoic acid biosynthesis glycosyltransferase
MVRRPLDRLFAGLLLLVAAPLLAVAAVGIRLASPGPILYRAPRVGLRGRLFTMYKLRTMHVDHGQYESAITAHRDPRIFRFGAWLRWSKIDELPQLLNVLRGDMAIVGPRPEVPRIVKEHYTPAQWETLDVAPGLTCPGSLYNYTHGEAMLSPDDPERHYVERLLPLKLALDLVYVRQASWRYDLRLVGRTVWAVAGTVLGRRHFPDPPEMAAAQALVRAHPPEGGGATSLARVSVT